ncbi:MAG: class I SAM-dependent methyltransferase [Anaerolineae bacterium]|nr:class I SAM-dependent methyltransferase [Anaerolineae bacterium]
MDDDVADRLLALNRAFYDAFADAFSDSRAQTEPGFERILGEIGLRSRVLDLGCGQGRFAMLLPEGCTYVGVDYAAEMLRVAEASTDGSEGAHRRFLAADLVADPWLDKVGRAAFDWVVLRAVLHHIPSYGHRKAVVRRAAQALAPHGTLVLANWQFIKIPRLMRRVVPWREIGLTRDDVDPGDYLLDWQRDGHGMRYVHLVGESETRQLAQDAGLRIDDLFFADGHTNDLTLYALLR